MENKIQNFLFWNHFIGNLVKKVWSSELFLRLPKVSSLALKWTMTLSIEASHLRGKYRPVSCQCYCVWCRCEACWPGWYVGYVGSRLILSALTHHLRAPRYLLAAHILPENTASSTPSSTTQTEPGCFCEDLKMKQHRPDRSWWWDCCNNCPPTLRG